MKTLETKVTRAVAPPPEGTAAADGRRRVREGGRARPPPTTPTTSPTCSQLTELELLDREKRAAERRLKAARFPTMKTLETFDFTARPSVNKVLVAELARCEYIDKRENILLVGNPGTGKSHLATALAAQACAEGLQGALLPHHRARHHAHRGPRRTQLPAPEDPARQAGPARPRRARLRAGLQGRRRAAVRRHLDRLRAHQPDRDHAISPSSPGPRCSAQNDSPGATLDRLTHRCRIIETKGESYRLHDAKTRSRRRPNPDQTLTLPTSPTN